MGKEEQIRGGIVISRSGSRKAIDSDIVVRRDVAVIWHSRWHGLLVVDGESPCVMGAATWSEIN